MTFEGQYLTYAEYQELGGSAIGETPFNLLEFEARKKIDAKTQKRLVGGNEIPQEVKLCEFAMINSIEGYTKTFESISQAGNLASESIDGYSVSYMTPGQISDIVQSKNNQLDDIILTYLTGVIYNNEHLIYVGIE